SESAPAGSSPIGTSTKCQGSLSGSAANAIPEQVAPSSFRMKSAQGARRSSVAPGPRMAAMPCLAAALRRDSAMNASVRWPLAPQACEGWGRSSAARAAASSGMCLLYGLRPLSQELAAVFSKPAAALFVLRAPALDDRPEALRMVHLGQVGQL